MAVEAELLDMYESQVTLTPPAAGTPTLDGQRAPGAAQPLQAHIEPTSKLVVNQQGATVAASGLVMLTDAYLTITHEWTLTLPDGTTPPIITVEHDRDPSGPYATNLYY